MLALITDPCPWPWDKRQEADIPCVIMMSSRVHLGVPNHNNWVNVVDLFKSTNKGGFVHAPLLIYSYCACSNHCSSSSLLLSGTQTNTGSDWALKFLVNTKKQSGDGQVYIYTFVLIMYKILKVQTPVKSVLQAMTLMCDWTSWLDLARTQMLSTGL